jgi:hypothetical protein
MDNNKAFIATLKNIKPIPGADRIVQADVTLKDIKITQVVVSVNTEENTLVAYFDSNMQLSDNFIKDYPDLGDYLGKNNRVKVVKLKGIISNGLCVEVTKFSKYINIIELVEGYSFTSLGSVEICKKYLPPVKVLQTTNKKGKKVKAESKIIENQFHFHIDTSLLVRNINMINPDQIISISRKVHGTSAICSNCLVRMPLNTFSQKIKHFFNKKYCITDYDYIYASRTVIKNEAITKGFYGTDIWSISGETYFKNKLHSGETVYYEIIGYLPGTKTLIQKGYKYGCSEGEYKIQVYRITMTAPDGTVTELSWVALKERCSELQVEPVTEYFFGPVIDILPIKKLDNTQYSIEWRSILLNILKEIYLEKEATDCDSNPDEGIVIRIEGLYIKSYKLKSEKFLLRESKSNEEGNIDIEDSEQAQKE